MLTLNTGNQVPVDQEIVCIHTRYGDIKDGDAGYILETKVMFAIFVSTKSRNYKLLLLCTTVVPTVLPGNSSSRDMTPDTSPSTSAPGL